MNFEDYLMEQFIKNNPQVLDDDIPEAFNDWKENADIEDIIEYAEKWKDYLLIK